MPYVRDSMWRGRDWVDVPGMQQRRAQSGAPTSPDVRSHRSLDGAHPALGLSPRRAPALISLPVGPSSWRRGAAPRSGPTATPRRARRLYTCRGDSSASTLDARDRRTHRRVLRRRHDRQDLGQGRKGQPDRLGRLPAREGGVLHEHAAVVPQAGGRAREPRRGAGGGPLGAPTPSTGSAPAQGVLRLADKYGAERLDAACRRAIEIGDPELQDGQGHLGRRHRERGRTRTGSARCTGPPARPRSACSTTSSDVAAGQ